MHFRIAVVVVVMALALPAVAQRSRIVSRQPQLRDEVTTTACRSVRFSATLS